MSSTVTVTMIRKPKEGAGEAGLAKAPCPAHLVSEWERLGWEREDSGAAAVSMADAVRREVEARLSALAPPSAPPVAPPSAPPSAPTWFYLVAGERKGPSTADGLAAAGATWFTLVWRAGMSAWAELGTVAELAALVPPPAPPPTPVTVKEG